MRRAWGLVACLVGLSISPCSAAAQGWFVGGNLGATEPTNDNYRAHVRTGFTLNPFGGYMFHRYVGAEGGLHFIYQSEDSHMGDPNFYHQSRQATTMLAATLGPRLQLPLADVLGAVPFLDRLEMNATVQGGYFVGTSGRPSHSAPGFTTGAGLNYRISDAWVVGPFARWTRAYMAPRPLDLGPGQAPEERMGRDMRWITAGLGVEYRFLQAEAAPPAPVPAARQEEPLPSPTRKKIVLRSVYFDFNKADLRPESKPVLDEAAAQLETAGEVQVVAEGHTDSVGGDAYNLRLGQARAATVRSYLVGRGVAADRIGATSFGESRPVTSNETAEGRAQNRRVELQIRQAP